MFDLPIIPFENVEQIYTDDFYMYAAATYNKLNRVRTLMYNKAKEKIIEWPRISAVEHLSGTMSQLVITL